MTETRKFKMHPDLLFSVIKAQAGTHEKALLEAVMNAVDAGATQCDIKLNDKGYIITDNGKGFTDRSEIENFFETFGTPHKEGDATYGKFRMGRGQLFAFSRTVWHSNSFIMDVCIKTKGLDYIFKEKQKKFDGCKITGTWHEKLKQNDILTLSRELKLLVKYMQIPIIFNGELISSDAKEQKWDKETPNAYIKVSHSSGVLSVYNLGALVCHYPASKFGVGGIVVAKTRLNVNFARNDILINDCKVWKNISKTLNELMGVETKKKSVLTDAERIAMVNNLLGGINFLSEYFSKGIFTDICSKKTNIRSLLKINRLSFSSGSYETRITEEKIHTQEISFILDSSMLERFGVNSPEQFVEKINELIDINNNEYGKYSYHEKAGAGLSRIYEKFNPTILPTEKLLKSFNSTFEFKNDKSLNKKEKCIIKCLNEVSVNVCYMIDSYVMKKENTSYNDMHKHTIRKISIGLSKVAAAWTDGLTYVAFSDDTIKNYCPTKLIHLLIHEYCHNESTNETHSHGIEFYEMFHDILVVNSYSVSNTIQRLRTLLLGEFTRNGIKSSGLEQSLISQEDLELTMV